MPTTIQLGCMLIKSYACKHVCTDLLYALVTNCLSNNENIYNGAMISPMLLFLVDLLLLCLTLPVFFFILVCWSKTLKNAFLIFGIFKGNESIFFFYCFRFRVCPFKSIFLRVPNFQQVHCINNFLISKLTVSSDFILFFEMK